MNLVKLVEEKYSSDRVKNFPAFRTGDTVEVGVRIREGEKTRIQLFQGTCISMKNPGTLNGHFRVRKISEGMGVERVFPFHSPAVESIKVISKGKSRRAKHFYLRERTGKAARIAVDYSR
ncbi:MAG TPA: 50S ribosomal protein L19 [Bacteriovoracaceae bacterium]|nr:50S ribosomal protein L19 [Bacteriovoracaceae bacterium]